MATTVTYTTVPARNRDLEQFSTDHLKHLMRAWPAKLNDYQYLRVLGVLCSRGHHLALRRWLDYYGSHYPRKAR